MNGETTQKKHTKKEWEKSTPKQHDNMYRNKYTKNRFLYIYRKTSLTLIVAYIDFFFRLLLRLGDKIDETRRIACIHSNNFFHSFTPIKYSTAANYEFEISRSQAIGGEKTDRRCRMWVLFCLSLCPYEEFGCCVKNKS